MSDSTFIDQFNQCIQSFKSFKTHSPLLLTEIRTYTPYTINILLDEIANIISSKGTSPAKKFYALYFLLKALERKHETLALALAQKADLVSKIFHVAQFDITKGGMNFERGITFFALKPSREQAKAGINFVKLCLELLTHLDEMYGVTSQKDPLYIYKFFISSLQKKGKIPKISWFIGKDYIMSDKKELCCWDFNAKSPLMEPKYIPDVYSVPIQEGNTISESGIKKKQLKTEESVVSRPLIDPKKNKDKGEPLQDRMKLKTIEPNQEALSPTLDLVMIDQDEDNNMLDPKPRQSKLMNINQNNGQTATTLVKNQERLTCKSQDIPSGSIKFEKELTEDSQNGNETRSTRSPIVKGVNTFPKKESKRNEINNFSSEAQIRMENRDEDRVQEPQTQSQGIKNENKNTLPPKAEEQESPLIDITPTNRQPPKKDQNEVPAGELYKVDRIGTEEGMNPKKRNLEAKSRESMDSRKMKLLSNIKENLNNQDSKDQDNRYRDTLKNMNEASGVINLSRSSAASYGQFRALGPRDLKEYSSSFFENTVKKDSKVVPANMQADLKNIENSIRLSMQNKTKYSNLKGEDLSIPSTQPRSFQAILNEIATTNGGLKFENLEENSLATKNEETKAVQNEIEKNERVPSSSFNKIYKEDLKFKKLFQSECSVLNKNQEIKKDRELDKGLKDELSNWRCTVVDRTKFACDKKINSEKQISVDTINSARSGFKNDKNKIAKETSVRDNYKLKPKEKLNTVSIKTEELDNKTQGPAKIFGLLAPYCR